MARPWAFPLLRVELGSLDGRSEDRTHLINFLVFGVDTICFLHNKKNISIYINVDQGFQQNEKLINQILSSFMIQLKQDFLHIILGNWQKMSSDSLSIINDGRRKELPSIRRFGETLFLIETIRNFPDDQVGFHENSDPCQELHQEESNSFFMRKPSSPLSQGRKKKIGCTCKKTQCLKMYCQCFSQGKHCGPECCCHGCFNVQEYEHIVHKSRESLKGKAKKSGYGCHCRKSKCRKKYCECFNLGIECGEACRCIDCQNYKQVDRVDNIMSALNISKFIHSQD